MAEEKNKAAARRERQARALRQNLLRRKAQRRDRTEEDDARSPANPAEGAKDEPSQE